MYYRTIVKPHRETFAILLVCRKTYHEAKSLWLGNLLFNFNSPMSLLDKLFALSVDKLRQIRHIRVREFRLPFDDNERHEFQFGGTTSYGGLSSVLRILPELRLDTLTVIGPRCPGQAYDSVQRFIYYGHGWKKLYFYYPNSEMLAFSELKTYPVCIHDYQRNPQPVHWNKVLQDRDGSRSAASVTVYTSNGGTSNGTVMKPEHRHTIEQKGTDATDMSGNILEKTTDLETWRQEGELLVVVERGETADISLPGKNLPLGEQPDLGKDFPGDFGLVWSAIKKRYCPSPTSENWNAYYAGGQYSQHRKRLYATTLILEYDEYSDANSIHTSDWYPGKDWLPGQMDVWYPGEPDKWYMVDPKDHRLDLAVV